MLIELLNAKNGLTKHTQTNYENEKTSKRHSLRQKLIVANYPRLFFEVWDKLRNFANAFQKQSFLRTYLSA